MVVICPIKSIKGSILGNRQLSVPSELIPVAEAFTKTPNDFNAAAALVQGMHEFRMHDAAAEIRAHMVHLLVTAIRSGASPDIICDYLKRLYLFSVKKIESESHMRACYQQWVDQVASAGRRYKDPVLPKRPWKAYAAKPWRPAFFLHNAAIVGHTEALLELLKHRPRGGVWSDPVVYILEGNLPELTVMLKDIGVTTTNLQDIVADRTAYLEKFRRLRQLIAHDRVSHLVWVSAPLFAEFALPMRLAPLQILWTLKFHPFQLPEIDGYITYGSWSEDARTVHGETWQVVPYMMSRTSEDVSPDLVSKARQSFARHDVIYGTLARTEKIDSEPFLDCVVQILRDNPRAAYLWTGQTQHAGIQGRFEAAGVSDRCHFIGWVDTALYARVLDVFLESFPFGCGLTGMRALEAGTPFVSFAAPETQYGMHFFRPLAAGGSAEQEILRLLSPEADPAPLLYASNAKEYVEMASKLATDKEFHGRVGLAGRQYYQRCLTDANRMAARFYSILADTRPRARAA